MPDTRRCQRPQFSLLSQTARAFVYSLSRSPRSPPMSHRAGRRRAPQRVPLTPLLRGTVAIALTALGASTALTAQDRPAARYQVELTKNVMVPMRDGIRLATDLYRPKGAEGKLPVVLMRTPYNKETYRGATQPAQFWAGQGYAAVVQDTRGQFSSEGNYRVEANDWVVKQPWSTGKVGTYGCSYLGEVQYLLAKTRHPNHLAMIPQAASGALGPAGGFYTNFGAYEGGALTLSTIFGWFSFAGH